MQLLLEKVKGEVCFQFDPERKGRNNNKGNFKEISTKSEKLSGSNKGRVLNIPCNNQAKTKCLKISQFQEIVIELWEMQGKNLGN